MSIQKWTEYIYEYELEDFEEYTPYIEAEEIKGLSVPCVVVDYKTGRQVELLSQGEKYVWYLLRYDDDVQKIYEQYALDLDITVELAERYGIKHPNNASTPMTTDFYVEKKDGFVAYSVKNSRLVLEDKRTVEKLFLEKMYWENRGVEFYLVFKEDLNMTLVKNIMDVVACYNIDAVFDEFDKIRYKIANKIIDIDLRTELIDYGKLREKIDE